MKAKLSYLAIFLICLVCVVSAGLLSVYRSEGQVFSDEVQAQIDAIVPQLFFKND